MRFTVDLTELDFRQLTTPLTSVHATWKYAYGLDNWAHVMLCRAFLSEEEYGFEISEEEWGAYPYVILTNYPG